MQAEVFLALGDPPYRIEKYLEVAREYAERSKEPRHRDLLPRIDELLDSIPNPFSFLDSFFRGKR